MFAIFRYFLTKLSKIANIKSFMKKINLVKKLKNKIVLKKNQSVDAIKQDVNVRSKIQDDYREFK